jgi:hypothetical protein
MRACSTSASGISAQTAAHVISRSRLFAARPWKCSELARRTSSTVIMTIILFRSNPDQILAARDTPHNNSSPVQLDNFPTQHCVVRLCTDGGESLGQSECDGLMKLNERQLSIVVGLSAVAACVGGPMAIRQLLLYDTFLGLVFVANVLLLLFVVTVLAGKPE